MLDVVVARSLNESYVLCQVISAECYGKVFGAHVLFESEGEVVLIPECTAIQSAPSCHDAVCPHLVCACSVACRDGFCEFTGLVLFGLVAADDEVGVVACCCSDHFLDVVRVDIVVAVYEEKVVAGCLGDAVVTGDADTLVFLSDQVDPCVLGCQLGKYACAVVCAAVVDHDDLDVIVCLVYKRSDAALYVGGAVIYRDYDGD